jgi:hypothetical protein
MRYVIGNFTEDIETTLGAGCMSKMLNYKDKQFKFQVHSPIFSHPRFGILLVKRNINL